MTTIYTLKEFEELDHLHIFEGVLTSKVPLKCNTSDTEKSCCGKIKQADYKKPTLGFQCQTAPQALALTIQSKKPICASCEQHIFKKYQELTDRA